MKDCLGQDINVGDYVCTYYSVTNSCMIHGEVVKLTPKNVRVKYKWHDGVFNDLYEHEFLAGPHKVVVLHPEQVTFLKLQGALDHNGG